MPAWEGAMNCAVHAAVEVLLLNIHISLLQFIRTCFSSFPAGQNRLTGLIITVESRQFRQTDIQLLTTIIYRRV